jgi:hypothetical protein
MVSLHWDELTYFFLRSGKGAQIRKECFDTSECQQNTSKLFPASSAVADEP